MPGAGAPVRWKQEAMTVKRMSAALPFAAAGQVADVSAETSGIALMVAPYPIDDAPSAGKGAFAFVDNFVWRAFVSLNWPSLLDATHNRLDPPNVSCLFTPPSTTHSTSSATSHPVARSASSEKKLSGRGKLLPQPESQLGLPIFARAKFGSRDNAVPMLADFAASAQMEPQCPAFARSGSQPASFSTPT
jgi:hypothetical protein